jgi:hypothetical protein
MAATLTEWTTKETKNLLCKTNQSIQYHPNYEHEG